VDLPKNSDFTLERRPRLAKGGEGEAHEEGPTEQGKEGDPRPGERQQRASEAGQETEEGLRVEAWGEEQPGQEPECAPEEGSSHGWTLG
jgi:hypothetical protein